MENKNIIYIPGRGISKAHFKPPTDTKHPEMPNQVTLSGTFKNKGNPNKLRRLFRKRRLKCWTVNIYVRVEKCEDLYVACNATFTVRCHSRRVALIIGRRMRNLYLREPFITHAVFKVTRQTVRKTRR